MTIPRSLDFGFVQHFTSGRWYLLEVVETDDPQESAYVHLQAPGESKTLCGKSLFYGRRGIHPIDCPACIEEFLRRYPGYLKYLDDRAKDRAAWRIKSDRK